jgi:hypothetical protein
MSDEFVKMIEGAIYPRCHSVIHIFKAIFADHERVNINGVKMATLTP